MSRRAVLLLLLAVLFFSLGYAVGHSAPLQQIWLTIEDGGRLMLATDHVVRFEGHGYVAFGEDRRKVSVPDDAQAFVDGAAVIGPRRVRIGETVQLRAGEETQWTLCLSDEAAMREGEGTCLTDDHPEDHARVDSAEPMTFFVRVRPGGQAHFFYPACSDKWLVMAECASSRFPAQAQARDVASLRQATATPAGKRRGVQNPSIDAFQSTE